MKLDIKALTPLWTGNIDQKSVWLQSTAIVGSIRWWTESILRGINKYVCNPTVHGSKSDGRCPEEGGKNRKYYCSACLIFGATGIRRMFRLYTSGGERIFTRGALNIRPSKRSRGWYLGSGIVGEINLEITPLDTDFDESLVLLPLIIASNWGGIGAKTQHGYGIVKVENHPKIDFSRFREMIEKITDQGRLSKLGIELRHGSNNGLPDFREMFFAKVQFEAEYDWWKKVNGIAPRSQDGYRGYINDPRMRRWIELGSVPIAPSIKNWLRYGNGSQLWKTNNSNQNRGIENWLFGTTERICSSCYGKVRKDESNPRNFWCPNCSKSIREGETFERIASKISISCAYSVNDNLWEFRIWGWIPNKSSPVGFDRNGFLDSFKKALDGSGFLTVPWNELLGDQTKKHRLKIWREFDSPRDTAKPNESNINNYIHNLLNAEVE